MRGTMTATTSVKLPDQNLYDLADTMQIDLYEIAGVIRGFKSRTWDLGGLWTLKGDVTVVVEHKSQILLTAFVRVRKHLWFYYVGTDTHQWLLAFDGDRAKIKVGAEKEFSPSGKPEDTLKKLSPSITRAFVYDNDKWKPEDVRKLLKGM